MIFLKSTLRGFKLYAYISWGQWEVSVILFLRSKKSKTLGDDISVMINISKSLSWYQIADKYNSASIKKKIIVEEETFLHFNNHNYFMFFHYL